MVPAPYLWTSADWQVVTIVYITKNCSRSLFKIVLQISVLHPCCCANALQHAGDGDDGACCWLLLDWLVREAAIWFQQRRVWVVHPPRTMMDRIRRQTACLVNTRSTRRLDQVHGGGGVCVRTLGNETHCTTYSCCCCVPFEHLKIANYKLPNYAIPAGFCVCFCFSFCVESFVWLVGPWCACYTCSSAYSSTYSCTC